MNPEVLWYKIVQTDLYQAYISPKTNACQKISFHSIIITIFLRIFLKSNSICDEPIKIVVNLILPYEDSSNCSKLCI